MHCNRRAMRVAQHEQGYILAGTIILLAVFMIMMAVAVPKVREDIRRDQEVETIRRGQQYVRALQLYYRRFHHFPASVDELEDTNGLRFLRRRYEDPLTRTDDWAPVFLGQNRAPLTMGYFGTVLNPGAAVTAAAASGDQARNSILGTPPASAFASFSQGDTSQQPAAGMPFGGGPMIGVRPVKAMPSILVYKTMTNYDEWEFVYDPLTDPSVPKWMNTPYFGAPGMPPPNPTNPMGNPASNP
jgi:type II secretory pathway pseudopilin PulG